MMWFPQIGEGSVAQFPLQRTRRWRDVENRLESGERLGLRDRASSFIEWRMSLRDLTDAEALNLRDLFGAMNGSYGTFSFVDPLANLLGWSEELTRPDWQAGLIGATPGGSDPLGGQRAWNLFNSAGGEQAFGQTVSVPASYVACFSVWLRSDLQSTVLLARNGSRVACSIGPAWKRFWFSGLGSDDSATFGLVVAAGQSVQAFGWQAEAQPYPSQYKTTGPARGIHQETRFGADELNLRNTAPGLTACDLTLISRV